MSDRVDKKLFFFDSKTEKSCFPLLSLDLWRAHSNKTTTNIYYGKYECIITS